MADPKGFLKHKRKTAHYRPVEERVKDYNEVEERLPDHERLEQASRCMDCGVPFCHWSCPLGNAMPEYNDKLFRGNWEGAWALLQETGPFSEFTGRLCPALCEAGCVLGANDEPVTCRQNELAVIERAFERGLVVSRPPAVRNGKKAAVVGSGPAGLSAAYYLNRAGFTVTVFEADRLAGGYLRYGIPFFKMEKHIIDRRIALMEAEGIVFKMNTRVGTGGYAFGCTGDKADIIEPRVLTAEFDAVLLAIGAREARDLKVSGRELNGVYQALDYLSAQNRLLSGENLEIPAISAKGKKVLVIGGGDTGSDCVGTARRQGAAEVTQIEVMPRPPDTRPPHQPWPLWAGLYKTTSSHEEGCNRLWAVNTKAFIPAASPGGPAAGNPNSAAGKTNSAAGKTNSAAQETVGRARLCKVTWGNENGRPVMAEVDNSDFEIEADLVVLAMGFTHVVQNGLVESLNLEKDARGNIKTDENCRTSNRKVWASGDSRNGASLIVRALADGRLAASEIAKALLT